MGLDTLPTDISNLIISFVPDCQLFFQNGEEWSVGFDKLLGTLIRNTEVIDKLVLLRPLRLTSEFCGLPISGGAFRLVRAIIGDVECNQDISYLFSRCGILRQIVGRWDTRRVTRMEGVFHLAKSFNQSLRGPL